MKSLPFCSLETLHGLWQNVEIPLIIHFESKEINICKRSRSIFSLISEKYTQKEILFLNMVLSKEEILKIFEDYGFLRFPAVMIYDYGEIQHRFNSLNSLKELEVYVKKALGVE